LQVVASLQVVALQAICGVCNRATMQRYNADIPT
jgi:hypothetical protein